MSIKNIVICLFEGYSIINRENGKMLANCTCTLIKTKLGNNIIIDTMTPWDRDKILEALRVNNISPEEISFVISTHGHSDHVGNNNLFLKAKHIVGQSVSFRDEYELHDFQLPYTIEDSVEVKLTKGHTLGCVSVIVKDGTCDGNEGVIGVVGDLFECYEDINDENIWREAGSEDEILQIQNRSAVADLVDYILPGHGPGFKVTENVRLKLKAMCSSNVTKIHVS